MMWNFSRPDSVAFIEDTGASITYAGLAEAAADIAGRIPPRSLVFSLCANTIGSAAGYVGFLSHRIVPLLLNNKLEPSLLQSLIDTYKPAYLWAPAGMKDGCVGETVYERLGYALIKTMFTESYPLHEDLALLLTTSGSTGSPKLVRQSYKNIEANTRSIVKYLKIDETERPITTLPMNYTYGLSIINSHIYAGATILLTDTPIVMKGFWTFFKQQQATSFGGVPYTYEMLDKMRFLRMELPSLKTMTQAGGKLSVELHKKFADYADEKGVRFVVMYGATEATARMSYLPHENTVEKYGSIGIAIPGGRFYVIGDDGFPVTQPGEAGELVYEGDNVTLGYAECGEDLIRGDERFGRLETGDLAKFDEEGYYYIVGRKKRFLKIFGNRVNLDEVERMIKLDFVQTDCACAGQDDSMYVFITDTDMEAPVARMLTEKTGLNRAAFNIITLSAIPRNDAGKTLYSELQSYYE